MLHTTSSTATPGQLPASSIQVATPQDELRALAARCLDQAKGDWEVAANDMRAIVMNDANLFQKLMMPMLNQAIWYLIRQSCAAERRSFSSTRTQAAGGTVPSADGLNQVAGTVQRNFYNYPLSGGLKLGDASQDKLAEEIKFRHSIAETNKRNADWLQAIASKTPAGKRVRDALSHDQLKKLAKKYGIR